MTYISEALRRLVYERAKGCCEYCRLHADDAYFSHEVDHIYAEKHGGATQEANLCFSCFDCNRHKGSDIASIDGDTGEVALLFHPRKDNWNDHFRIASVQIRPLTAQGRVTVRLLQLNIPDRLLERDILIRGGSYPCPY
jgi:hypothetical protein